MAAASGGYYQAENIQEHKLSMLLYHETIMPGLLSMIVRAMITYIFAGTEIAGHGDRDHLV